MAKVYNEDYAELGLLNTAAFDSAIAWRQYAGYLETELAKAGVTFTYIANNVTRATPPKSVLRTVWE